MRKYRRIRESFIANVMVLAMVFSLLGGLFPMTAYAAGGGEPIFSEGYPQTANVTETSLDLLIRMNKAGTAYYKVLGAGAAAPDSVELKNDGISVAVNQSSAETVVSSLNSPTGVAVDDDGNVYVADQNNKRVRKYDPGGALLFEWTGFNAPWGVAVDGEGNIYVPDNGTNPVVKKYGADGAFICEWGGKGTGDGQFDEIRGIAVDNDGYVYVVQWNNSRVQKFTAGGAFVTKWGSYGSGDGQFKNPTGVGVDGNGNVYVADYWNHRIQKFTSEGAFLAKWGANGTGDGQFYKPSGVAVDPDGNIYVTEYGNHRVQKLDANGNFLAKWGTATCTAGAGEEEFNGSYAAAADGSGTVYVADRGNNRIKKLNCKAAESIASGLSEGMSYDIYVAAEDTSGDLQPEPVKIEVTMAGTLPPYENGSGTEGDPYQISNVDNLIQIGTDAANGATDGKYYRLMNDIDLLAIPNWEPIGTYSYDFGYAAAFEGSFDGNHHVIRNLKIDRGHTQFIGLFGCIYNASITDLGVENASVAGDSYVGALVGYSRGGTVNNSYATGSVSCIVSAWAGGLIGVSHGSLANCYADCSVSGQTTGGLIGLNAGSISACYASGSVTSSDIYSGGLVGSDYSDGGISNCYWDKQTTGQEHSEGSDDSCGKTTAEMKQKATFDGWDMDASSDSPSASLWVVCEGKSYPYFRNTPERPDISSSDPAAGAFDVGLDKTITVTYGENMQAGAGIGDVTLKKDGALTNIGCSIDETALIIDPEAALAGGAVYTVTVPSTAVKNLFGVHPANDCVFSFETIQQAAAPEADPPAGAVAPGTMITLRCGTEGAVIYYTIDGSEPTGDGTEYTSPIAVNSAMTIKAVAVKPGMADSDILTAEYTVLYPPAAPANPIVDDANDTFGWTNVPGFGSYTDYEYSVDSGASWNDCTANPQPVGDHDYAAGAVRVRVKADAEAGRPAGEALLSDAPFTATSASDSSISPSAASFDKRNPRDISVAMTLNGNTLLSIRNGAVALTQGADYTVSGNTVTIKKDYLRLQAVGTAILAFDFSAGADRTLTVSVSNSTPASYPQQTLTDPGSGISVTGSIRKGVELLITELDSEGDDYKRLEVALNDGQEIILSFEISLSADGKPYAGDLILALPVGAQYNGQTLTLLHDTGSGIERYTGVVANGMLTVTVNGLSPYAVVKSVPTSGLPDNHTLYAGGRVIWTPFPSGGTWQYNAAYLAATANGSSMTFSAINTGSTTVTYMVNGMTHAIAVTILEAELPKTGQDFVPAIWLFFAGLCVGLCAISGFLVLHIRRRSKERV